MFRIDENFKDCVVKIKQPDVRTPFQSIQDATDRLLPYHLLSFPAPNVVLQGSLVDLHIACSWDSPCIPIAVVVLLLIEKNSLEKYAELEAKVSALENRLLDHAQKSIQVRQGCDQRPAFRVTGHMSYS